MSNKRKKSETPLYPINVGQISYKSLDVHVNVFSNKVVRNADVAYYGLCDPNKIQ